MHCEKLKNLIGTNGIIQRQVAVDLKAGTAYFINTKHNKKIANRSHLNKHLKHVTITDNQLLPISLMEKGWQRVKNEKESVQELKKRLNKVYVK